MKPYFTTRLLIMLISLTSCSRKDQPQPVSSTLTGNWVGVNNTQQLGSCAWSGDLSVAVRASFQVTTAGVTGSLTRGGATQSISGQVTGSSMIVSEVIRVVCNSTWGSYTARYEGSIGGDTLRLTSRDTLCPMQGCIFLRTLKLVRQP